MVYRVRARHKETRDMKSGDKVPSIRLHSDSGDEVDLASASAHGKTVIYFYPKDDTPGCTREAQAFTAAAKKLASLGAKVYGISKDGTESHCRFRDKYNLNFPLLSDKELAAHKAFGAWGEKTMYGKKVTGVIRSTFLVEDGKVSRVYSNVKVDGHIDQVLAALGGGEAAPATKAAPAKKAPAKKAPAKSAKSATPAKKSPAKHSGAKKTSKKK
jgi:peroxiredoxin Q/BCP